MKKALVLILTVFMILGGFNFLLADEYGSGGSGSGQRPIFTLPTYVGTPYPRHNIKYGTAEIIYSQGPVITYVLIEKNYETGYENKLGYIHAKGYSHLKDAIDLYSAAGGFTFVWSYKDIQANGNRDKWKW